MYPIFSGSKPISLAETASIATWIGRSQDHVLHHGVGVRGPVPSPAVVPSMKANMPGMDLLLDRQQVDQRLVNPGMRVVPVGAQQPAEGVLHRAGGGGVDMGFHRRQVDDVLAEEIIGDADSLFEDLIQHQHLRLGLVFHPGHIFLAEIVFHRDAVMAEDRDEPVQVLALEGVGHHRLILHADQVVETRLLQREDGALQLPGGGIRAGQRIMPGDVVLQDRGHPGRERLGAARHLEQALIIRQHGLRRGSQYRNFGFRRHRVPFQAADYSARENRPWNKCDGDCTRISRRRADYTDS